MNQPIFAFESGVDSKKIIQEIRRLSDKTAWDWVKPIIDVTLDEYVALYLQENRLSRTSFNPCRVEDNLAEAAKLLDICVQRKAKILALESQVLLTVLDISLSSQLSQHEQAIAKTHWDADHRATAEPDPVSDPISQRFTLLSYARDYRNALHNERGSSLNYGERVENMRYLYADSLRLCYARLSASWIGLNEEFANPRTFDPRPSLLTLTLLDSGMSESTIARSLQDGCSIKSLRISFPKIRSEPRLCPW